MASLLIKFASSSIAQPGSSSITLLFLLLYCLAIAGQINAQCYNNGNFTANSTYAENRRLLFSSLLSNFTANGGFFSGSLGSSPNTVYAQSYCRGDLPAQSLTASVNFTVVALTESCPYQKQGANISLYPCTVRYSDSPIYGILDMSGNTVRYLDEDITMNQEDFDVIWANHMYTLAVKASKGSTKLKFATGEASLPDSKTIYALLQCSPDLSESDCRKCLAQAREDYHNCCRGKAGGAVPRPSCFLRWDLYYFYVYSLAPPPPSALRPSDPPADAPPPISTNTTRIDRDERSKASWLVVIIIVVIIVCLFPRRWKLPSKLKAIFRTSTEDLSQDGSLLFKLSEIRAATDEFSDTNKLGQGGFGKVYKGKLVNGQQIAVKRLEQCSQEGKQQFKNEMVLMARLQHRNLVKLVGFCIEEGEQILIYEFVQHASLDRFISDPIKRVQLDWAKRYNIIKGIARGLLYLHVDSQLRIIHRDIKPGNILLDEDLSPKIADFGTARLFASEQSRERTRRIAGTYGYMPPEYVHDGEISRKTDVYSFGVVVLEIISGQKNGYLNYSGALSSLVGYAWKNWKKGTPLNLADPILRGSPRSEILKCIHIALLCIEEDMARRPTMATVTMMLSQESHSLPRPLHPAYLTNNSTTRSRSQAQQHQPLGRSTLPSVNGLTFSEPYPR